MAKTIKVDIRRLIELAAVQMRHPPFQGAPSSVREDRRRQTDVTELLQFPAEFQLASLQLSGISQPLVVVGGDYYAVRRLNNRVAIFVADAMGHGFHSAIHMTFLNSMLTRLTSEAAGPEAICSTVNEVLNNYSLPFITMFCACVDILSRKLVYCNAGHVPPILWSHGALSMLDRGGPVLGILRTAYEEAELDIHPGDRMVIYTDGLTEAGNPAGEQFGDRRLAEVLDEHGSSRASALRNGLWASALQFGGAFADDATLVVLAVD
jgi:sigma-B regulation protein RsbU (phosphoserine phosphatase)